MTSSHSSPFYCVHKLFTVLGQLRQVCCLLLNKQSEVVVAYSRRITYIYCTAIFTNVGTVYTVQVLLWLHSATWQTLKTRTYFSINSVSTIILGSVCHVQKQFSKNSSDIVTHTLSAITFISVRMNTYSSFTSADLEKQMFYIQRERERRLYI